MYTAMTDNHGDSRHYATTKDHTFGIDTEGKGANPVETLLAGLCGCLGHWIRDYFQGKKMDNPGFTVKAEATPTEDRQRLARIGVEISLKGMVLDEQGRGRLIRHIQNCILHNTLKTSCPIDLAITG